MTHTIAIIGAGFSGTIMAARLMRAQASSAIVALRIVLINRGAQGATDNLGRGLAYGTKSDAHLLNVPAGRMSAFPEAENDFLDFLAQRGLKVSGGTFVSRRWYGEYLRHILDSAIAACGAETTLEIMGGEVASLSMLQTPKRGGAQLKFANGRELTADRVVLALGNFAPTNPALREGAGFLSARYIRDPWAPGALDEIDGTQPIALIGTGLTMFDVVLSLSAKWPQATFNAFSRRGLLPQAHREATSPPQFDHAPEHILEGPATARAYLRAVRTAVTRYVQQSNGVGNWRDVIASLRPITPALWQRLPQNERARLLRHVLPYWESHRHRAAPAIARTIDGLVAENRLKVMAARLVGMTTDNNAVQLTLRRRHQAHVELMSAGTVINCTGPTSDFRAAKEALMLNLHAQGLISPDLNRLGIEVNDQLQVIDTNGRAITNLFCVGPLLKAGFWEATAVPELREHARTAAQALLASLKN